MRALGLVLLLSLQDEPVRELIDRMGSGSSAERTRAFDRLRERGRSAEPELRAAASHADSEVALRTRILLRGMELKETLPPALLSELPGVEYRLALHPGEWVSVLEESLRTTDDGAPAHPALGWAEQNALAAGALTGATTEHVRQQVCQLVSRYRLRAAVPVLQELLEHPDLQTRRAALRALSELRCRESVEPIARLLLDGNLCYDATQALASINRASVPEVLRPYATHPNQTVRFLVLSILRTLAPDLASGLRETLLHDPDRDVRLQAAMIDVRSGGSAWMDEFLAMVRENREESWQDWDFEPLRRHPHPVLVDRLRAMLEASSAELRRRIVMILGCLGDADVIPDLETLLEDPDSRVRMAATEAIRELNATPSRTRCERLLTDPCESLRDDARTFLLQLHDPEHIAKTLARLRDPKEQAKVDVVRLLTRFGIQAAAPDLLGLALKGDADLREAALQGLSRLEIPDLVPNLIPLFADPNEDVADAALNILSKYATPNLRPAVVELTRHAEGYVRRRAVHGLSLFHHSENEPLLLQLLDDPDPCVRYAAMRAAHPKTLRSALPQLRRSLGDPDRDLKIEAIQTLASLAVPEIVDDLAPLLDDKETRLATIEALGNTGTRRVLPLLSRMLEAEEPKARNAALNAIIEIAPDAAIEPLRRMLRSPKASSRRAALHPLKRIQARELIPDLLPLLRDPVPDLQSLAAQALVSLEAKEAVAPLLELVREDRSGMRSELLQALARLGVAEIAPRILELLHHEDPDVVEAAVESACILQLRAAIPALIDLSRNDDLNLRWIAARALLRLGDDREVETLLQARFAECHLLNRLRQPELWERLQRLPIHPGTGQSVRNLWEELACGAGVELVLENLPYEGWEESGVADNGRFLPPDRLEALLYWAFQSEGPTVILEEDRIRLVSLQTAMLFWREWWRSRSGR